MTFDHQRRPEMIINEPGRDGLKWRIFAEYGARIIVDNAQENPQLAINTEHTNMKISASSGMLYVEQLQISKL